MANTALPWRERLGNWIGGKRASSEPLEMEPSFSRTFGPGLGNQPAHATLLQESLGVPDFAARAIANRMSALEPLVKTTRRVEIGTVEDEILDDHPMKMLLDRPHPNLSWRQMIRLATQWVVTVGESYWLKVGDRSGIPRELHPMPPAQVTPLVRFGVVEGYRVTDGNGAEHFKRADQMIRFFFPDPENPWGAEGYLGPAGTAADAHKFGKQHLRSHFQHDATPKTVLESQPGAESFTAEQYARFAKLWNQHYQVRGGDRVGVPALTPTGFKLIQLMMQNGADVTPLLEYWQKELLMGYGVPKSVLGQVESGDRSSAETNQFVFDIHTILPIASMVEDSLTLQLASEYDDPGLFMEFAPFVSKDKDFTLRQEAHDLEHAVRTVNTVLKSRAEAPVEWGDRPTIASTMTFFDPDNPPISVPGAPLANTPTDRKRELQAAERQAHIEVRQHFRRLRKEA